MYNNTDSNPNASDSKIVNVKFFSAEQWQIIREGLKLEYFQAYQLQEVLNLSRSTVLKLAQELVDNSILLKEILAGTERKYRPTFVYCLNPSVTQEAISKAIATGFLYISNESFSKAESEHLLKQKQPEEFSPDIQPLSTEDAIENSYVLQEDLDIGNSEEVDENYSHEVKHINFMDNSQVVSIDEILEVFEQTTKILMEKITEQESRIAELEKRFSMFQSARTTKDPKEVLRDVRSRFNLISSSNSSNGNHSTPE